MASSVDPIYGSLRRQRNNLIKLSVQYGLLLVVFFGVAYTLDSWIRMAAMIFGGLLAGFVLVMFAFAIQSMRSHRLGAASIDRSQSRPCQLHFRRFPYLRRGGIWVVDIRFDEQRLLRPLDMITVVPDDGVGTFIGDPSAWGAVQLANGETFVAPPPDAKSAAWIEQRFAGMAY